MQGGSSDLQSCKDVQPEVKGASLAVPEAEQGSCCGLIALSPLLEVHVSNAGSPASAGYFRSALVGELPVSSVRRKSIHVQASPSLCAGSSSSPLCFTLQKVVLQCR